MARQLFKIFFLLISPLLISLIVFFFWAKQEVEPVKLKVINHQELSVNRNDSTIGLLAYNIGYLSGMNNNLAVKTPETVYKQNLNKLLEVLDKLPIDIVAFQEIDYRSNRSYLVNQHEEIASRFFPYSILSVNWDKRYVPFPYWPPAVHFGKMLSGQSTMGLWEMGYPERIVLKPVETNPFYYNNFYLDRLAVSALVKHPLLDFWLINVHTEAFDQPTRKQQIEKLHQMFKQKSTEHPVIMLGDFNSSPDFDEAGIQLFLNDTSISCAAFDITTGKYENSFPSEKPTERLDYIFYSKADFDELESKVLKKIEPISDHLPVFAKLKIKR